ncbi:MAG: site-2 protease family protein [Acidobacteria bacterium]|nr:site-2 protease family protein [Acidobacteriota bacterium]
MRLRFKPLTVAKIFEIPIKISLGWFPVFGLHIYAVSVYYLPRHLHHMSEVEYWILGVVMTVLFFFSVLGHELGHALFARAEGLRIYDITLHLFGGLTRFDREASTPLGDFKIGMAGPASSFLHVLVFFILNLGSVHLVPSPPVFILTKYLAMINLILALFNLLPGFPLDGGRILRAWLWHRYKNFWAATRWATQAGRGMAYFLIAFGAFWIITWKTSIDIFIGVWSIFIGIFLKDAADGSWGYWRSLYGRTLRVADAMNQPVTISPETTIEQLIGDILPVYRRTSFPVSQGQQFLGIVSLERIRSLPRGQWSSVKAREVMLPVNRKMLLHPNTPLSEAQALLGENEIGCAGVLDDQGYLVGFIGLLEIHKKLAS